MAHTQVVGVLRDENRVAGNLGWGFRPGRASSTIAILARVPPPARHSYSLGAVINWDSGIPITRRCVKARSSCAPATPPVLATWGSGSDGGADCRPRFGVVGLPHEIYFGPNAGEDVWVRGGIMGDQRDQFVVGGFGGDISFCVARRIICSYLSSGLL